METCVAYYQLRIKQLLEKLLDSSCPVKKIQIYLDQLLSHLTPLEEKEINTSLITLPVFTEWLIGAVNTWTNDKTSPTPDIATFTLNVASILSKNEDNFSNLNINNFFIKLINVSRARQEDATSPVKLAYIRLLSSFLEHKSGIEWMIASVFCEDVLQSSLKDKSIAVAEESRKFMSKILEKTIDHDETFCYNIIKRITLPLSEEVYKSIKNLGEIMEMSNEIMSLNLKPALQLIGDILEYFLDGIFFEQKDFQVPIAFLKNFQLKERISDFLLLAKNKNLSFDVAKIMLIMQFLELYIATTSPKKQKIDVKSSIQKIKDLFIAFTPKGCIEDFLDFCTFGQLYWNIMNCKIPQCEVKSEDDSTYFGTNLALLQLMPNSYLCLKFAHPGPELEELLIDDLRDFFLQKLWKLMSQDTIRVAYYWRDHILTHPNFIELATKSLSLVLSSRKHYRRETAVIIFQCVVYSLKDILQLTKDSPEKMSIFSTEVRYFCLVFELLAIFIEEFKISWKDGFEAVNVTNVTFNFMSIPNLAPEVVAKVFKVGNISLDKYMCPNLALLIDKITDSTIVLLGPVLYLKLHDNNSEVRRSALEVVETMSRLSKRKFPSLQKLLMDADLPIQVVRILTVEVESVVRKAAIKCLQEMIQVEEFWNKKLRIEVLEKMQEILFNETDRNIRVETATCMCIAYEHRQFPEESLKRIYKTMIHSSTTDFNWKVKATAMRFWDKVIKNHLQNQGMIDGSFPRVTFSKEQRKIVTLTDLEIRKRLLKVLDELSSIGCLNVLMTAIQDDCNIEVSKTALKVTQQLIDLFKKYDMYGENETMISSPSSSGISSDVENSPHSNNIEVSDDLIDELLNLKDVCVSNDVCSPSDYGSICCYDIQTRQITSSEFLGYTQRDLENIIATKNSSINGIEELESLLNITFKICDPDNYCSGIDSS